MKFQCFLIYPIIPNKYSFYNILIIYSTIAVGQYYEVDVNKEPVIKGNSVVMKCGIPSFVADFVAVLSWSTDKGDNFYPGIDYGIQLVMIILRVITDLECFLTNINSYPIDISVETLYTTEVIA